jgi:hypothetical protein
LFFLDGSLRGGHDDGIGRNARLINFQDDGGGDLLARLANCA